MVWSQNLVCYCVTFPIVTCHWRTPPALFARNWADCFPCCISANLSAEVISRWEVTRLTVLLSTKSFKKKWPFTFQPVCQIKFCKFRSCHFLSHFYYKIFLLYNNLRNQGVTSMLIIFITFYLLFLIVYYFFIFLLFLPKKVIKCVPVQWVLSYFKFTFNILTPSMISLASPRTIILALKSQSLKSLF